MDNSHKRVYHTKTEMTYDIAKSIEKSMGVESVTWRRYSIDVIKGEAFEWPEVEPGILEILSKLP